MVGIWYEESCRTFDGVEYLSTGVLDSRKKAEKLRAIERRNFKIYSKGVLRNFPLRSRIIKVKGGWRLYVNNTARNLPFWREHGRLPRKQPTARTKTRR